MSDQRAIARELVRATQHGESVVLASVVRTEGASYRGVGARMVMRADGTTIGLLSGGCLEGELAHVGARVRESGQSEIFTYDGRSNDDLVWGLGLGCNGLVDILLERRTPESAGSLGTLLSRALDDATPSVLVTVVRASGAGAPAVGARVLVRSAADVSRDGDWGFGSVLSAAIADACGAQLHPRRGLNLDYVIAQGDEHALADAVSAQLSFEVIAPSIELVVLGGGPDIAPVTALAQSLGWDVTVVDSRPVSLVPRERVGSARVVECAHSDKLGDAIAPSARTAVVVMSHGYERDLDYLDVLARSDARYIGMLGPRTRTERLLHDLEERGRPFPGEKLSRLYSPIGLDLGGDGAEAIALAVIAEIAAVMHGRTAAHLRERSAQMHEAPSVG